MLLLGDPNIMAARAVAKNKMTNPKLLEHQQDLLRRVFEGRPGVRVIKTAGMTKEKVAKEIATAIYFEERYDSAPMHDWLCGLEDGRISSEPTLSDSHAP
jgi:hypothetical protein